MLDLRSILDQARKSFLLRKRVDFKEQGLHFELGPLTSAQETTVTDRCMDLEGVDYFDTMKRVTLSYSVKKINEIDLDKNEVEVGGNMMPVPEYLEKEIATWPAPLRDRLFEAYSDLYTEIETKIGREVEFKKFERPKTKEEDEEEQEKFTEIKEPESDEDLTPTEKLNKAVEKEIEREEAKLSS